MYVNRTDYRRIRKAIGKDACVLCAAVAERSNGVVRARDLELAHYLDDRPVSDKLAGLRQWITDFDAGLIVPDGEAEEDT